jgi:hypothetical protein
MLDTANQSPTSHRLHLLDDCREEDEVVKTSRTAFTSRSRGALSLLDVKRKAAALLG